MQTSWQDKVSNTNDTAFSDKQNDYITNLIQRFTKKTARSKIYAQDNRSSLSDSKAASGFRLSVKEMFYPIVGSSSHGAYMRDIDGNDYIDVTMGYGSNFLGNNPSCVTKALEDEIKNGIALGVRSEHVGDVAKLICNITGHDRVVFCNTGTEAVMTAIRLARAKTDRKLIVLFTGSYHGHSDITYFKTPSGPISQGIPASLGIPSNMLDNLLILEYGSEDALKHISEQAHQIAAVLVEPVQAKNPTFKPFDFLKQLRILTEEKDIALIFDEMITGFRAHPAGVQGLLGIKADLTTYGKVVGGGLPMGVVAGKSEYLDFIDGGYWEYGDETYPKNKKMFFGGTYCQHPLAIRASKATLEVLANSGTELQANLNNLTEYLCNELNNFFVSESVPIKFVYFSSMFRPQMPSELDILYYLWVFKGLYICEWRNCFLSTAHTNQDIEKIIKIVKDGVYELKESGFL